MFWIKGVPPRVRYVGRFYFYKKSTNNEQLRQLHNKQNSLIFASVKRFH